MLVLAYPKPDSPALNCPACHCRTLLPHHRQLVEPATRRSTGWVWDVARCAFCQHERQRKFTIARLEMPAASSSSSSSGSWGQFQ